MKGRTKGPWTAETTGEGRNQVVYVFGQQANGIRVPILRAVPVLGQGRELDLANAQLAASALTLEKALRGMMKAFAPGTNQLRVVVVAGLNGAALKQADAAVRSAWAALQAAKGSTEHEAEEEKEG